MRRQALRWLAAALALGSAAALAQSGDLSSVTMRVLDDVSDVDAVVLALDANRGESEDAAGTRSAEAGADDGGGERSADTAERADDERREPRRERDALHDVDADERSEGRLEDRDVERPAVPPATVP